MICEYYAKKFCCEDLSLIENYDMAIADTTQTWDCHHRGEILPCGKFSVDDLKKFGLYYNRPAAELIFLTHSEHRRLHTKGVPRPDLKGVPLNEDHKNAISDSLKGVPRPDLKGVPKSEATKKAISDAMKGVNAKKILQFTKSGEFIREWPSMREAERELGIAQSSICSCCKGIRKYAGGYVWEYA